MYLLYLDESGNEDNPADRHFVLAGLAVFERCTHFLAEELEKIQTKHFPGLPPIEFHASPIRKGKDFWRKILPEQRASVLADIASAINRAPKEGLALFAAVVEKTDTIYGERAVEAATEQVLQRFDTYLKRKFAKNDPQRGLMIFSEGRFDARAKVWVRQFRSLGTRWGTINNLADVPYFASVKETRLLQAADYVAHAVFMMYEQQDPSLLQPIINRFDQKDGVLHGIHHNRPQGLECVCPACSSRRKAWRFGTMVKVSLVREEKLLE